MRSSRAARDGVRGERAVIALSPGQGAVLIFFALLASFVLAIAIGVLLRMRFGEKRANQEPNLSTYLEHRDRPAICICQRCKAWRAEQRRRVASLGVQR